jgi:predicted RNase H-like HicB family nuclease
MKNKMELTILYEKCEEGGYAGQLYEYPQVISQGETIDELKENLDDALRLFLEYQGEQLEEQYKNRNPHKRKLVFTA